MKMIIMYSNNSVVNVSLSLSCWWCSEMIYKYTLCSSLFQCSRIASFAVVFCVTADWMQCALMINMVDLEEPVRNLRQLWSVEHGYIVKREIPILRRWSGASWDFITLLKVLWNLELKILSLWSLLFNIFGLW